MARKGNQAKNGLDRHTSKNKKRGLDSSCVVPNMQGREQAGEGKFFPGGELPNDHQTGTPCGDSGSGTCCTGDENKSRRNSWRSQRKEKQVIDAVQGVEQPLPPGGSSTLSENPGVQEENGDPPLSNCGPRHTKGGLGYRLCGQAKTMLENVDFSNISVVRNLREFVVSISKSAGEWLGRQGPLFVTLKMKMNIAHDYVGLKIQQAYPFVLKWLMNFGNIMLLLSVVWLDCTLRGIDSFLRMGTTSFFSVLWCSILSAMAMVGWFKFLIVLAISAFVTLFVGLTLGILIIGISGTVFLWFYGSFWTTALVIFLGGLAFMLSQERLALLITTVYSVYSAWTYVGWLGLLLGLNLSFISSDILIYILSKNLNQQRRTNGHHEQTAGMQGQSGFFNSESEHPPSFETSPGLSADRGPGVPSTSGVDSELNSEEEVVRLLNCTDHYSALGLPLYENVDVSLLKREYRKKAMLVHPDKNMGNEKAAEAFKKLQNAYEVLLDSLKRKTYDDELRREELLNYFRKFQSTSQQNGRNGFFSSGFSRSEADGEDPLGESRRIACKKCSNFHIWIQTRKSKSRARWCQDCNDFHQAKDGDGWVEQSSQPFFFGLLQKVDTPTAYVCADSKIYNATEWYICQEMRCPANSHKPSFHVNSSVTSKHNSSKGSSSGQRGSRAPKPNVEETMTEEEFFEWFQNAVQTGMFESFNDSTSTESPSPRAGNGPKSGGSKRKKKGKKQW
ncbi:uncharacterized protein LOC120013105 isoform X2 [Tripterygium wilfordii]|uniref:uncharacterized protein LOC120013105 isoform X2 n=1 Tax=Tripterygium wilfordii TaxID=458696 RepID=UPI0018F82959|nr:uncharacterized protein LOC120013105 isoform X2 [Tripterygium wilfordii]